MLSWFGYPKYIGCGTSFPAFWAPLFAKVAPPHDNDKSSSSNNSNSNEYFIPFYALCCVLPFLLIIVWICCWHLLYNIPCNVDRWLFPIQCEDSGWCHWGKKATVTGGGSVEGRPTDECWDLAMLQCHLWLACRREAGETLCCMWQVTGFCSSPDVWPTL